MKRLHNTDHSKELIISKQYLQNGHFKPNGLWYAIEDDWLEWCHCEMSHWIKKYLFKLDINMSNVLSISNKIELGKFFDKYNCPAYEGSSFNNINWSMVVKDYKGIEIINYYDLKWNNDLPMLSSTWLYGWDVSGGCIWDLTVLNGFTKIDTPKKWFVHD